MPSDKPTLYEIVDSNGVHWVSEDNPAFMERHMTRMLRVKALALHAVTDQGFGWSLSPWHVVSWRVLDA